MDGMASEAIIDDTDVQVFALSDTLEFYNADRDQWVTENVEIVPQSAEYHSATATITATATATLAMGKKRRSKQARRDHVQVKKFPKFELTRHTRIVERALDSDVLSTTCGEFQLVEVRGM